MPTPPLLYVDAAATYEEMRDRIGGSYAIEGSVKNLIGTPYRRIMRDCAETMTRLAGRFGLTPSDRAGLDISTTRPRTFGRNDPERILG
jgi:phage terminase small subunit